MGRDNVHYGEMDHSELEECIARFRSLSLTPNNWIWEVDTNGVYTYCSPGVFDIFGYHPEEILGKKPSDFLSPEDGIILRAIFQKAIFEQMSIKNMEILTKNKNGKDLFFKVNGVPFFSQDGNLMGYRGINHDITKIKDVEIKLSEERLFLKTLLESIPDLIWLKDPNGIYLACNPKFEHLYGASEAEIVGKTDFDFITQEQAELFRLTDKEAVTTNKSIVKLEWVNYIDDGHSEFIETIKTPIYDSEGILIGILGVARDITRHKQIEEALKKS